MDHLDIQAYFAEFAPSAQQLRKLEGLLRSVHRWWGIEYGTSILDATLVIAPARLCSLSVAAFRLLKRCQGRKRAFNVQLERRYGPFDKQTYRQLFGLLLSLGLIQEATLREKLGGSTNAEQLRSLLRSRGLSAQGRKAELVDRVLAACEPDELERLAAGVVMYCTTSAGDEAIRTIDELYRRMQMAFTLAVTGTRPYFEATLEPRPALPPGVLYDDGEVQITEADVEQAIEEGRDRLGDEFARLLGDR